LEINPSALFYILLKILSKMNPNFSFILLFLIPGSTIQIVEAQTIYFPDKQVWLEKIPSSLGLHNDSIANAVQIALDNESKNPANMEINHYRTFGKEPFGMGIGPFETRGKSNGLIICKGYIIAKWGDPHKCDMTHSVTKSFLSTVAGLALEMGHIKQLSDPVYTYLAPIEAYHPGTLYRDATEIGKDELLKPFDTDHNRKITWEHLLRQTSDWEGTLWEKPDWADRPDADPTKWLNRKRSEPGTVYEYNDVRVNALALALTSILRKPLPQVLKEKIMDPIGASDSWRWTGYRNAWMVIDGSLVQAVSGGGHWGGGMIINSYDLGKFGLFTLNKGNWNNKRILPEAWFARATKPTEVKTDYGFMNYFLNTDRKMIPSAPPSAYMHVGNGTNFIFVDDTKDLVVVGRWMENAAIPSFIQKIYAAWR
jgi:CubicO group peptidase (beta-lactamase class C family)